MGRFKLFHLFQALVAISFLAVLSACSTVERISEDNSLMFDLSVKVAVNRLVGDDLERAERLLQAATSLRTLASKDESTVEAIRAAIYDYVDREKFQPDERLLLNELSILVGRETERRVEDKLLNGQYSVLITRVADLVIESVTFYLQTRGVVRS